MISMLKSMGKEPCTSNAKGPFLWLGCGKPHPYVSEIRANEIKKHCQGLHSVNGRKHPSLQLNEGGGRKESTLYILEVRFLWDELGKIENQIFNEQNK